MSAKSVKGIIQSKNEDFDDFDSVVGDDETGVFVSGKRVLREDADDDAESLWGGEEVGGAEGTKDNVTVEGADADADADADAPADLLDSLIASTNAVEVNDPLPSDQESRANAKKQVYFRSFCGEDKDAWIPERDGTKLVINPSVDTNEGAKLIWSSEKGFVPEGVDGAEIYGVEGRTVRVTDDWSAHVRIRQTPVCYEGGDDCVHFLEVETVEYRGGTDGEFVLPAFPLANETAETLAKSGAEMVKGERVNLGVKRDRLVRVFFAEHATGMRRHASTSQNFADDGEDVKLAPDGGICYAFVSVSADMPAGRLIRELSEEMGVDDVDSGKLFILTHPVALVGLRRFLQEDVVSRREFRREVPTDMPLGSLPNHADLLLSYTASVQKLAVSAKKRSVERGDLKNAPARGDLKNAPARGDLKNAPADILSPVLKTVAARGHDIVIQKDGRRVQRQKDGRRREEYVDGGRLVVDGGAARQTQPDGAYSIAARRSGAEADTDGANLGEDAGFHYGEPDGEGVVYAEKAEGDDMPDRTSIETVKMRLSEAVRGVTPENEPADAVDDTNQKPLKHKMLVAGELYGGDDEGVRVVYEHDQYSKRGLTGGLVLVGMTDNYDVDGNEYSENWATHPGETVGEFKERLRRVITRRGDRGTVAGLMLTDDATGELVPNNLELSGVDGTIRASVMVVVSNEVLGETMALAGETF